MTHCNLTLKVSNKQKGCIKHNRKNYNTNKLNCAKQLQLMVTRYISNSHYSKTVWNDNYVCDYDRAVETRVSSSKRKKSEKRLVTKSLLPQNDADTGRNSNSLYHHCVVHHRIS